MSAHIPYVAANYTDPTSAFTQASVLSVAAHFDRHRKIIPLPPQIEIRSYQLSFIDLLYAIYRLSWQLNLDSPSHLPHQRNFLAYVSQWYSSSASSELLECVQRCLSDPSMLQLFLTNFAGSKYLSENIIETLFSHHEFVSQLPQRQFTSEKSQLLPQAHDSSPLIDLITSAFALLSPPSSSPQLALPFPRPRTPLSSFLQHTTSHIDPETTTAPSPSSPLAPHLIPFAALSQTILATSPFSISSSFASIPLPIPPSASASSTHLSHLHPSPLHTFPSSLASSSLPTAILAQIDYINQRQHQHRAQLDYHVTFTPSPASPLSLSSPAASSSLSQSGSSNVSLYSFITSHLELVADGLLGISYRAPTRIPYRPLSTNESSTDIPSSSSLSHDATLSSPATLHAEQVAALSSRTLSQNNALQLSQYLLPATSISHSQGIFSSMLLSIYSALASITVSIPPNVASKLSSGPSPLRVSLAHLLTIHLIAASHATSAVSTESDVPALSFPLAATSASSNTSSSTYHLQFLANYAFEPHIDPELLPSFFASSTAASHLSQQHINALTTPLPCGVLNDGKIPNHDQLFCDRDLSMAYELRIPIFAPRIASPQDATVQSVSELGDDSNAHTEQPTAPKPNKNAPFSLKSFLSGNRPTNDAKKSSNQLAQDLAEDNIHLRPVLPTDSASDIALAQLVSPRSQLKTVAAAGVAFHKATPSALPGQAALEHELSLPIGAPLPKLPTPPRETVVGYLHLTIFYTVVKHLPESTYRVFAAPSSSDTTDYSSISFIDQVMCQREPRQVGLSLSCVISPLLTAGKLDAVYSSPKSPQSAPQAYIHPYNRHLRTFLQTWALANPHLSTSFSLFHLPSPALPSTSVSSRAQRRPILPYILSYNSPRPQPYFSHPMVFPVHSSPVPVMMPFGTLRALLARTSCLSLAAFLWREFELPTLLPTLPVFVQYCNQVTTYLGASSKEEDERDISQLAAQHLSLLGTTAAQTNTAADDSDDSNTTPFDELITGTVSAKSRLSPGQINSAVCLQVVIFIANWLLPPPALLPSGTRDTDTSNMAPQLTFSRFIACILALHPSVISSSPWLLIQLYYGIQQTLFSLAPPTQSLLIASKQLRQSTIQPPSAKSVVMYSLPLIWRDMLNSSPEFCAIFGSADQLLDSDKYSNLTVLNPSMYPQLSSTTGLPSSSSLSSSTAPSTSLATLSSQRFRCGTVITDGQTNSLITATPWTLHFASAMMHNTASIVLHSHPYSLALCTEQYVKIMMPVVQTLTQTISLENSQLISMERHNTDDSCAISAGFGISSTTSIYGQAVALAGISVITPPSDEDSKSHTATTTDTSSRCLSLTVLFNNVPIVYGPVSIDTESSPLYRAIHTLMLPFIRASDRCWFNIVLSIGVSHVLPFIGHPLSGANHVAQQVKSGVSTHTSLPTVSSSSLITPQRPVKSTGDPITSPRPPKQVTAPTTLGLDPLCDPSISLILSSISPKTTNLEQLLTAAASLLPPDSSAEPAAHHDTASPFMFTSPTAGVTISPSFQSILPTIPAPSLHTLNARTIDMCLNALSHSLQQLTPTTTSLAAPLVTYTQTNSALVSQSGVETSPHALLAAGQVIPPILASHIANQSTQPNNAQPLTNQIQLLIHNAQFSDNMRKAARLLYDQPKSTSNIHFEPISANGEQQPPSKDLKPIQEHSQEETTSSFLDDRIASFFPIAQSVWPPASYSEQSSSSQPKITSQGNVPTSISNNKAVDKDMLQLQSDLFKKIRQLVSVYSDSAAAPKATSQKRRALGDVNPSSNTKRIRSTAVSNQPGLDLTANLESNLDTVTNSENCSVYPPDINPDSVSSEPTPASVVVFTQSSVLRFSHAIQHVSKQDEQ